MYANTVFTRTALTTATSLLLSVSTNAHVIPDASLKNENSIVIPNQVIDGIPGESISGGAIRGSNLFHSFQRFNIKSGHGVFFRNPQGIQNIFARVNGNELSTIDGVLGVLGGADLFLLNPNGFIFGPNAQLNLNGSFLATSADYIKFKDGQYFSAHSKQIPPSLTISTPIGLGFTGTPGPIKVQGSGHTFQFSNTQLLPSIPSGSISTGLNIKPDKTIALVGGEIFFRGGIINAPSGRIEVGSILSGELDINKDSTSGFLLRYNDKLDKGNILLSRLSLLNASGFRNGNIHIFGNDVTFTDSSFAVIENYGSNTLGKIQVTAQKSLTILGDTEFSPKSTPNSLPKRGLTTSSFASGKGASINISTEILKVDYFGRIITTSLSDGRGGDLTIKASKSISISGNSPFFPQAPLGSTVATTAAGTSSAGQIKLISPQLTIEDGGQLASTAFRNANGGDIVVKSETIKLSGFNSLTFSPSIISTLTGGNGKGGNLLINSKKLILQSGGRVDASTLASGPAGSITIDSKDLVSVSGVIPGSVNPSLIISSANVVDPSIQVGLELPPIPSGESGSISIKTNRLEISDGAEITVRNDGPNDAGQLSIIANRINVENNGTLSASTNGGNGGNIQLFSNLLVLNNGNILSFAKGDGNGGNIDINTNLFVGFGENDISANAINNRGGNIRINATGLFLSPGTKITASSEAGPQLNGTVTINTQKTGAEETTTPAPDLEIAPQVVSACNPSTGASKFVAMGPGALPMEPIHPASTKSALGASSPANTHNSQTTQSSKRRSIREATGWKISNGKLTLIVKHQTNSDPIASHPARCQT